MAGMEPLESYLLGLPKLAIGSHVCQPGQLEKRHDEATKFPMLAPATSTRLVLETAVRPAGFAFLLLAVWIIVLVESWLILAEGNGSTRETHPILATGLPNWLRLLNAEVLDIARGKWTC